MGTSDKFRIGDQVLINFSGSVSDLILQPHKEAIKEDGTITPPLVGSIVAAGRTPGDLQQELKERYDKLYRNLTVTVLPADRYYYVSGEVRKPGPEPYLGETDIIKAIAAAMDFTDFANKRKVTLTRANGQKETINVQKILNGKADDVPIYPGDKIVVKRRLW
jgi:polysaccharide export outer membrane protein